MMFICSGAIPLYRFLIREIDESVFDATIKTLRAHVLQQLYDMYTISMNTAAAVVSFRLSSNHQKMASLSSTALWRVVKFNESFLITFATWRSNFEFWE
jgi:hypothetical protein